MPREAPNEPKDEKKAPWVSERKRWSPPGLVASNLYVPGWSIWNSPSPDDSRWPALMVWVVEAPRGWKGTVRPPSSWRSVKVNPCGSSRS